MRENKCQWESSMHIEKADKTHKLFNRECKKGVPCSFICRICAVFLLFLQVLQAVAGRYFARTGRIGKLGSDCVYSAGAVRMGTGDQGI